MFTPDYLKGLPDKLTDILQGLEDFTIRDIARRLAKAGEATSTAEWQRIKLQELGAGTKAINKKIAETMGVADAEIERMFRESSRIAIDNEAEIYEAIGVKQNTKYVDTLAEALISQTKGEIHNFTKTMGLPMKNGQFVMWTDAYRNALDMAVVKTVSGTDGYISAIRAAIKPFADDGICTIGYQSGRRFTIEAAARMCVLQGVKDMASEITERTAKEIDADGYEVTAHADCAPDHINVQGKQYSLKEYEKLNDNLARPIGTLGCRHMAFAIRLDISTPVYTDGELQKMKAENEKGITYEGRHYTLSEAGQMQRELERAIRGSKRKMIGYDELGLKDDFTAASIRLRRQRDYYTDFSKKAGLLEQGERTHVSGYGRSISGKALYAEKHRS